MRTEQLQFESGDASCLGTAYLPDGDGPHPCVVLCCGFGGTQDTAAVVAAAQAFAGAGFAALTFDYRSFGRSEGHPRQVVDIGGQLNDIRAAIAYARSRTDVDDELVILWGTSLGGGHVVSVAADDPRLCAVVAQVPFNGFPRRVEQRSTATTVRLLAAILADALAGRLGRQPRYIKMIGAPDEVVVMGSDEAMRAIENVDSPTWQNKVAPRGLLQMMRYQPGRVAARLTMPLLVCVAEFDRETLGENVLALAQAAPKGVARSYPIGHFDIYRADVRTRVLADQIHFVRAAIDARG
ncbi:alpha/beta hydrolase [Mycolicibacterium vaccae]|uniref:alpha/beta hydrolase n=1 Tax=Mycolicibacterium vaccae TaxID=1810 RepID=UPI003D089552